MVIVTVKVRVIFVNDVFILLAVVVLVRVFDIVFVEFRSTVRDSLTGTTIFVRLVKVKVTAFEIDIASSCR